MRKHRSSFIKTFYEGVGVYFSFFMYYSTNTTLKKKVLQYWGMLSLNFRVIKLNVDRCSIHFNSNFKINLPY